MKDMVGELFPEKGTETVSWDISDKLLLNPTFSIWWFIIRIFLQYLCLNLSTNLSWQVKKPHFHVEFIDFCSTA